MLARFSGQAPEAADILSARRGAHPRAQGRHRGRAITGPPGRPELAAHRARARAFPLRRQLGRTATEAIGSNGLKAPAGAMDRKHPQGTDGSDAAGLGPATHKPETVVRLSRPVFGKSAFRGRPPHPIAASPDAQPDALLIERRMPGMPVGDGLERMAGTKQQIFRQMFTDELEANRSATLIEATVHRKRRHSRKVELVGGGVIGGTARPGSNAERFVGRGASASARGGRKAV
jgi:hypothetical protein